MAIRKFRITLNGVVHEVEVEEVPVHSENKPVSTSVNPTVPKTAAPASPAVIKPSGTGNKSVSAPMSGKILSVKVKAGDSVKPGDTLVILEAMKMENEIQATGEGTVVSVAVKEGVNVSTGDLLIDIQ